jgi:ketosteroid isomerase-like protein
MSTFMPFAQERSEIRDLIERSSDAINHEEWASFESMMTEDVVWERMPPMPWTLGGLPSVRAFLADNSHKLNILHYEITGTAIQVTDAIHAHARSTMSELIHLRDPGTTIRVVGTYADRFIKTEHGWQFARRTITPRFEHDVSPPIRLMTG